jgi:hypothetical protein
MINEPAQRPSRSAAQIWPFKVHRAIQMVQFSTYQPQTFGEEASGV